MSEAAPSIGSETARTDAAIPARRGVVWRYLARFDDGEVIRWAFRGLLAGAAIVLGLDAWTLYGQQPSLDREPTGVVYVEPALPPALRTGGPFAFPADPRDHVTLDAETLQRPLSFELKAGGVMAVEGSIDVGSARRLAEELAARGEYVRTLSLNSPGGSVEDAMAMARLARERGLATEVADGALCASSCPLLLAGGATRSAGEKAAIGLHQFYAAMEMTATDPAQAMSDAQATAARISRYLAEMGVDPALWLHALDTPPHALYYLSREELAQYRLISESGASSGG